VLSYPRRSRENRRVGTRYLRLGTGLTAFLATGLAPFGGRALAAFAAGLALGGVARFAGLAGGLLAVLEASFVTGFGADFGGALTGATLAAGVLTGPGALFAATGGLATTVAATLEAGLAFSGTDLATLALAGLAGAGRAAALPGALTGTTRGT